MAWITAMAVSSAYGRGLRPFADGLRSGRPAASPVTRFDVGAHRAGVAATLPGARCLEEELALVVDGACERAGLTGRVRARTPLVLAQHAQPETRRIAAGVAGRCGLAGVRRVHTSACVAGSAAVQDAVAVLRLGGAEHVVVAGGSLVDAPAFAAFDGAGVLAPDGVARPFSAGRRGPVLGDAAAAVVLRGRGPGLARIAGWGCADDAHHVIRPHPEGAGIARAIGAALRRAGVAAAAVGYVNAHGTATPRFDASEAAALHHAGVGHAAVSSTKALHGHVLEASGVVELVATVLAQRDGVLPVNAGYLGPDPSCRLDLVVGSPRPARVRWALTLNAGFGGTCAALLVEAPDAAPDGDGTGRAERTDSREAAS